VVCLVELIVNVLELGTAEHPYGADASGYIQLAATGKPHMSKKLAALGEEEADEWSSAVSFWKPRWVWVEERMQKQPRKMLPTVVQEWVRGWEEIDPAIPPMQAVMLEKSAHTCRAFYSVSLPSARQRHLEVLGWPFLWQYHLRHLPIPLCLYFFLEI